MCTDFVRRLGVFVHSSDKRVVVLFRRWETPLANFAEIRNNDVDLSVGDRTHIGTNVVLGPNCRSVTIGFGCFIGNDVYIDVEDLVVGDYTTIHHGSVLHGVRTRIGHNCWVGHYTIIDSLGGDTRIGNNVGVGAHSQLWSHMKFGDVLNGCRWNSSSRLWIDDDVWLVGHCVVGPIHAEEKSMLMTGSVAVRDMASNRIYAGSPAIDVSANLGSQFEEVADAEKARRFNSLRAEFCAANGIDADHFVLVENYVRDADFTQFRMRDRSYLPIRSNEEYDFIRFMLYDKAKWTPLNTAVVLTGSG